MAKLIEVRDATDGRIQLAVCQRCTRELRPRERASQQEVEKKYGWKFVDDPPGWWCGPCWKTQLQ